MNNVLVNTGPTYMEPVSQVESIYAKSIGYCSNLEKEKLGGVH